MSEKLYTETDMVERERDAFFDGAHWQKSNPGKRAEDVRAVAARIYAAPTKPREVTVGDYRYRVRNGVVECVFRNEQFWGNAGVQADTIHALAGLLANPLEDA